MVLELIYQIKIYFFPGRTLGIQWAPRTAAGDGLRDQRAGESSRKPFVLEARYRRHDGQWRWLRSESQPRWGPAGEHIGYIGVAHDVTASKEAEQALTELNETLERRIEDRTRRLEASDHFWG